MRMALAKQLLDPAQLAPKLQSEQEALWAAIRASMPAEAFTKHVLSDPVRLDEYMTMTQEAARLEYREETALTAVLRDTPFSFSWSIGIDAYPQKLSESSRGASQVFAPVEERRGVLTFYIEGTVDKGEDKQSEENYSPTLTPRRRKESAAEKQERSDLEKLMSSLQIAPREVNSKDVTAKNYPLTATEFLDMTDKWYQTVMAVLAAKKEQSSSAGVQNRMYQ